MGSVDDGRAFAPSDLWKESLFTNDEALDTALEKLDAVEASWLPSSLDDRSDSRPWDLDNFSYGSLDIIISGADSSSASIELCNDEEVETPSEDEDVYAWTNNEPPRRQTVTRTWDCFYGQDFEEQSTYISEAGPLPFDSLPHVRDQNDERRTTVPHIKSSIFVRSLFQLGLGTESRLFEYRNEVGTFQLRCREASVFGLTVESTRSIIEVFGTAGKHIRSLGSFTDETYASINSSSVKIAFAETVASIVSVLVSCITQKMPPRSILELQALFQRPSSILSSLDSLVGTLYEAHEDEAIMSKVYDFVQQREDQETWLRRVHISILARISKPWLDSLSSCIGLRFRSFVADGLLQKLRTLFGVGIANASITDLLPSFLGLEECSLVIQICEGLELLQNQQIDNIFGRADAQRPGDTPTLEWQFEWRDIARIEEKAKAYEANILRARADLKEYPSVFVKSAIADDTDAFNPFGTSQEVLKARIDRSCMAFQASSLEDDRFKQQDQFHAVIYDALSLGRLEDDGKSTFVPPLSLLAKASFGPIIRAQARIVNRACLRTLLEHHDLASHLRLQRRYHLFGDGIFASRLSHALFDPSLSPAERRKGYVRSGTLGLRLGSRDTWPPASSELRLALMGILTESYYGEAGSADDLPGDLSFAIRDLSEEETQKCLNPYSLEALDFLRLQYKAPPPLNAVITSSCLEKYDMIFRLLLRMMRMLFVVNQLAQQALRASSLRVHEPLTVRFCVEARHFVSNLCDYFNTAIEDAWDRFLTALKHVERRLGDPELEQDQGLYQLRMLHEEMLDTILYSLLLRKHQMPIMKLLEETLGLLLSLSKGVIAPQEETAFKVQKHYNMFREKTAAFLTTCRGLSAEKGRGTSGTSGSTAPPPRYTANGRGVAKGMDERCCIAHLVLRLEMNDWYTRR